MITTTTPHQSIETKLSVADDAVGALRAGDLILFPSDTLWSVGCDLKNPVSLIRLARLQLDHDPHPIEILVSSVEMLKRYVKHLHPRLETLLIYHRRPLSLVIEDAIKFPAELEAFMTKPVFRVVPNGFVHEMITKMGYPLVSTFAYRKDFPLPVNLGSISSDILEKIDKVYNLKGNDPADYLSVMVELSEKEELNFLRE